MLPANLPAVFFNVSHSGDYALVALSDSFEVGIDIEQVRADCPIDDLARRYYSTREHRRLRTLSPVLRLRDFYRLWTIKEAVLKCAGLGLSVPPAVVEVQLADAVPPKIHCLDPNRQSLERVAVRELDVAAGYASSLAVETPGEILINRR